MKHNILVGQKLYEPSRKKEVEVGKVGRKNFYILARYGLEKEGFNLETLSYQDPMYSHRIQLYLSREAYDEEQDKLKLRREVQGYFQGYSSKDYVSDDQIIQIATILNILPKALK